MQPKKPGPYGPGKDNFKCEKSSESLYVTKVSYTTDTKCFTVFKVDCDQTYTTGKVRPSVSTWTHRVTQRPVGAKDK